MAPGQIKFLTEADVGALVDLGDAINALEAALHLQYRNESIGIPKALGLFGDGASLHALGSVLPGAGIGGFKTWINTKKGAAATMTLFDVENGRLLGFLEAGLLGQLRTAGISGLATRWLAAPEADDMALIGTGRQAMLQIAAVSAVRRLKRLRVFSPTAERLGMFIAKAKTFFEFEIVQSDSVEAALRDAPIVTLITRAKTPFATADMFAHGAHINAVGSVLPANAEFTQDVFGRAGLIVVDSIEGVQLNSAEFVERFGQPGEAWNAVLKLSDVIGRGTERPAGCDLTLFKAMGMGLSDLAVARLVMERAEREGAGSKIVSSGPVPARWNSNRD